MNDQCANRRPRIMVVENEPLVRDVLADLLRPEFDVLTCSTGLEALDRLAIDPLDAVLAEVDLVGMDGFELRAHIARAWPDTAVLLITSDPIEADCWAWDDDCLIPNPFDACACGAHIRRAVQAH